MKFISSKGLTEQGVVVGNTYQKYFAANPLVRVIHNGFEQAILTLMRGLGPNSTHELGCGEGYWVILLKKLGFSITGSDFSHQVIQLAQSNALASGIDPNLFTVSSIYNLKPKDLAVDCIMCLEVLEHLEDPQRALHNISQLDSKYFIFSVPREPLWRFLNFLRGKYITQLGNTPGHVNHWSQGSFIKLLEKFFKIEEVKSPIPWTVVLAKKRTR